MNHSANAKRRFGVAECGIRSNRGGWRFIRSHSIFWIAAVFAITVPACNRGTHSTGSGQSAQPSSVVSERPLGEMKVALRRGDWQKAWTFADGVLDKHADDPEAIALVAQVAHNNQEPSRAADLLAKACEVESYSSEARVQQTMIAMISVGRLFDGMDVLAAAIEAQPDQIETRRWLFDFYVGTEDREAASPHGRYLVRKRKFDLELLMALSNTERRTLDAAPLEEMITRFPDDLRPMLGSARTEFDQGNYADAIESLTKIAERHPKHWPAQILLARAFASSGEYEELERWMKGQPETVLQFVGYWIAIGDWARHKEDLPAATRAYWEAARRDPDTAESWTKLAGLLRQLDDSVLTLPDDAVAAVEKRAELLSKFSQAKSRFERTGSISREIAMQMVQTLDDLGRLWEAEAWASIATTLPENDEVPVDDLRSQIVSRMTEDTPWQTTEGLPEFQIRLTNLPVPSITEVNSAIASSLKAAFAEQNELILEDEAAQRGLDFFGRTSDDLNEPGIMLYQTLGCGGGTIDFDRDGWSDLYLMDAGGTPPERDSRPNALFRNQQGQFVPVPATWGAADVGFGQGVAIGDVNEDGFSDLLVLNYGPNTLWLNNGDGSFTEASERLPKQPYDQWSTSGAIADIDGDGLSDIVVVNYCTGLGPVIQGCPMKDSEVVRSCSPMMFAAESDGFLQSKGDGTLIDQTQTWSAKPSVPGRGLGIVVGEFDATPGNDVFIANDMTNNHYWSRAKAENQFALSDSAMIRGLGGDDRSSAQGSMGIATADFDGDADIDFYVTNFDGEYNTFHTQKSGNIWQDETAAKKLIDGILPLVGFGTEAVDLENDGVKELIVTNGHVDLFSREDEKADYDQPMSIFRQDANHAFFSIADSIRSDYVSKPHVGRALWTIDADANGVLDLVVTHQTEPVSLLINQSNQDNHWIAIDLVGRQCSRDAIGARVTVSVGENAWTAVRTAGDGYLCSNESAIHFGLGSDSKPCDITVTWPGGAVERFEDLAVDRKHTLMEGH